MPGREILNEMGPGNPIRAEDRSPALFAAAPHPVDGRRSTYDHALRLLEFRARTVVELRRKLLGSGTPTAEVDDVVARLCDQKLLDDVAFSRQFARTRVLGAGASRRRIVMELKRKGVPESTAAAAFDELQEREGIDPSEAIDRVASKKWKSLGKLDEVTRRRRLYAFLARRGFDADEIRTALHKLGDAIER